MIPECRICWRKEKISSGHARALLGLEDRERQYQVAVKIVEEKLSVRDVEKLVKMMNRPPKEKKPEKGPDIDLIYRQVEDKLKSIIGTKVVINQKDKNKGKDRDRVLLPGRARGD